MLCKVMAVKAHQVDVVPDRDTPQELFHVCVRAANRDDDKKGNATSYRRLLERPGALADVCRKACQPLLSLVPGSVAIHSLDRAHVLTPDAPPWLIYAIREHLRPMMAAVQATCRRTTGQSFEVVLALMGNADTPQKSHKHFQPQRFRSVRDFGRPLLVATKVWTSMLQWSTMAAAVPEALHNMESQTHDASGLQMLRLMRTGIYDFLRPTQLMLAVAALRSGIPTAAACSIANIGTRLDGDQANNDRSFTVSELHAKVVTYAAQLHAARAKLKVAQNAGDKDAAGVAQDLVRVAQQRLGEAKKQRNILINTKESKPNLVPGFMSNTSTAIKGMFRRTLNIFQTTPLGAGCDLVKALEFCVDCLPSRSAVVEKAIQSISPNCGKRPADAAAVPGANDEETEPETPSQRFWIDFFKQQDLDTANLRDAVQEHGADSSHVRQLRKTIAKSRTAQEALLMHVLFDGLVVSKGPRTFKTTTGAVQVTSTNAEREHLNDRSNLSARAVKRYQAKLIRKAVKRAARTTALNKHLDRASASMNPAETHDFFAERLRDHLQLLPLFRWVDAVVAHARRAAVIGGVGVACLPRCCVRVRVIVMLLACV
jgi:hypothetical protein